MRLLKAFLYSVISLCFFWACAVIFGPTIILFVTNHHFGEQKVSLTGLSVSPKLKISATSVEFDLSESGKPMRGKLRAPVLKIRPSIGGWSVQIFSGLLQLNDTIEVSSLEINFRTSSITQIKSGMLFVNAEEVELEKELNLQKLNVSSSIDLASSVIRNVTAKAQNGVIIDSLSGEKLSLNLVSGHLSFFSLLEDLNSQSFNFSLEAAFLQSQSNRFGEISVKRLVLDSHNDGQTLNSVVSADSINIPQSGLSLVGVEATSDVDAFDLTVKEGVRLSIERGDFEHINSIDTLANFHDLEAVIGLHMPDRFLQVTSDISDLKIRNGQAPLVTIPQMTLDMEVNVEAVDTVQDVSAQFKVDINGNNGPVLNGNLISQLLGLEGQSCLLVRCVQSKMLINVLYQHEGERLIATGSCSAGTCVDGEIAFSVQTSNTQKIVEGLRNQKMVNPLALVFVATSMMQGNKIGPGHKIEF